jgi:hypothetical protein
VREFRAGNTSFPAHFLVAIAVAIFAKLMHSVVLAKLSIVAIFPNVAAPGIEERVVSPAIRELDTDVLPVRHGGLGLKDWFQYDYRKKAKR